MHTHLPTPPHTPTHQHSHPASPALLPAHTRTHVHIHIHATTHHNFNRRAGQPRDFEFLFFLFSFLGFTQHFQSTDGAPALQSSSILFSSFALGLHNIFNRRVWLHRSKKISSSFCSFFFLAFSIDGWGCSATVMFDAFPVSKFEPDTSALLTRSSPPPPSSLASFPTRV